MPALILSIDPGFNAGFALMDLDKKLIFSTAIANDPDIEVWKRQQDITNTLNNLIDTYLPDVIVIEEINRVGKVGNKKNKSTYFLYWMFGQSIFIAGKKGIPVEFVNPMTMKAAVSRIFPREMTGPVKKPEIKAIVKRLYGNIKITSDESDAIGIALAYWMIQNGEYVLAKDRKKKVKK